MKKVVAIANPFMLSSAMTEGINSSTYNDSVVYFNITKDQLSRTVIPRPVWKYHLSQEQQDRHVY